MEMLINAQKVYSLAFSTQEAYTPAVITDIDIIEAQSRFIEPILGRELLDSLIEGNHADFVANYAAPTLAAYVRYLIEPLLELRSTPCHDEGVTVASNRRVELSCETLRRKAATLRRRMSDYLNSHAEEFSEYNPENNPLNHCVIYGNIVQTL
jgi:hypothetical protein